MNPFNLQGSEFLFLYLLVLAVAGGLAFRMRWLMRTPADDPPHDVEALLPYEIAYLTGGEQRAVDAAIVRLVHLGVLGMDSGERRLTRLGDVLPQDAQPLEQAVFDAVSELGSRIDKVRLKVASATERLRAQLEHEGLVLPRERVNVICMASAGVMLAATLFGGIKILVGMSRNKPVEYLMFLVLLSVGTAIFFFRFRPLRTRRGDLAFQKLRHENAALESAAGRRLDDLVGADLVVAMGLFGLGVLAGGPLNSLATALRPPARAGVGGGGSCGGSSCSGSSCGGGSCGGGCGGGGCGGCGG